MVFDTEVASTPLPGEEFTSPLEGFLARRQGALAGLRRVAGTVAALFGPRRVAVSRTAGAGPGALSAADVLASIGHLHPAEEPGVVPLREAAERVLKRTGEGAGAAVCLTGALVLQAIQVLDEGIRRQDLVEGLEVAGARLLETLREFGRSPEDHELVSLLEDALPGEVDGPVVDPATLAAGVRSARFLVLDAATESFQWRVLRGALALLAPQGRFVLPEAGSVAGPHRVLGVKGPLRTEEEVGEIFGRLGSFEEPLLLLADRLSPRAATRAASLSLGGGIHGHLLWAAGRGTGADWGEGVGRVLGAPVLEEASAAADLAPADLPLASEVHFLGPYVVAVPADPERRAASPRYDALLHPEGRAGRRALERACRRVERARESGVVPGGGATYLALARRMGEAPAERVLRAALEAPLRVLVENGGMDAEAVLDRIRALPEGSGYDLVHREFFSPDRGGPVMPLPVVAEVLAASLDAALRFLRRGAWSLGTGVSPC